MTELEEKIAKRWRWIRRSIYSAIGLGMGGGIVYVFRAVGQRALEALGLL